MDKDQLFIRTLKDLDNKLNSQDEYENFMVVPLLRKLILDKNPLIDQVNQQRHIRVMYTINDVPDEKINEIISIIRTESSVHCFFSDEDLLNPNTVPCPRLIEVTKDKFLSRPVIRCGAQIITVSDLIQHAAHIQGAVHLGKAKTEKDKALKQFDEFIRIGGLPAGLRQLLVIGRIIRKALEPLRSAIQEENHL